MIFPLGTSQKWRICNTCITYLSNMRNSFIIILLAYSLVLPNGDLGVAVDLVRLDCNVTVMIRLRGVVRAKPLLIMEVRGQRSLV